MSSGEPRRPEFAPWLRERAAAVNPGDPGAEVDALAEERERGWQRICPHRFRGASLAGLNRTPEDIKDLTGWVDVVLGGDAPNLILIGDVGRGKTYAALAVSRAAYFAGRSVVFSPVVELLEALRPEGDGRLDRYLRCGVLVLDDLGGERVTDWTAERLYLIINRRWLDGRPIVATTNLEPPDLREAMGPRSYDRLRDGGMSLRLVDEDSRRRAWACDNDDS